MNYSLPNGHTSIQKSAFYSYTLHEYLWGSGHIQTSPDLHGFDLHDFRINAVAFEDFELNFVDKTKC